MVNISLYRNGLSQNYLALLKSKAFWSRRGKLTREVLNRYLQEIKGTSFRTAEKANNALISWMEVFTCKCGWLLQSPCTLPCGHTICKLCFDKSEFCAFCGEERGQFILNTTLDGLLEQWYPKHYKACSLKEKAVLLLRDKKFEKAVEMLNEALSLFGNDFTALNLRSEAYRGLGNVKMSFKDAKKSCAVNNSCGESFFQLGESYALLNKFDNSVEAFNTCLELEPEDGNLNSKVVESLDRLLSMSPGSEIEVSDDDDDDGGRSDVTSSLSKELLHNSLNLSQNVDPIASEGKEDFGGKTASSSPDGETEVKASTPDIQEAVSSLNTDCSSEQNRPCPKKRQRELSPKPNDSKTMKLECTQAPHSDDFECKLCFCLLFDPVTTACGHVFCKKCIERCVDYNPSCPICRRKLTCMETTGAGNVTLVIQNAIEKYFPEEIKERRKKYESHLNVMARVGEDEDVDVPIFACTMALPGIQCPLHIFEPKYRMMLRECLESGSNKFGMCKVDKENGFINYGTIVEVKHVRYLPDGRSLVDTVGVRRFKVKDRTLKEGISHAKVEYFEDDPSVYAKEDDLIQLINKCRATYDTLLTYIGQLHISERECIINALGHMPNLDQDLPNCPNGPAWMWWALCALPLTDQAKVMMFKSQSLLDRVTILQRYLNFISKVNQNRHAVGAFS